MSAMRAVLGQAFRGEDDEAPVAARSRRDWIVDSVLFLLAAVLALTSVMSSARHGLHGPMLVVDAIAGALACLALWWRRRRPMEVGLAVVGLLVVLWGSQGALQTAQHAQAEIWHVPASARPSFWARLGRTGVMLAVLGVFLVATTVLAGLVTIGHHGTWTAIGAVVLSLILNVSLFGVAFRVLTPRQIDWSDLWPGAIVGGAGWTVLQYVGGLLVQHNLRNTSKVYGSFALVLGLIAFLYLSAQMTVYAAEVNVVRARRLWPRSMVQPPLTPADREVLSSLALEGKRRPEQYVGVGFIDTAQDDDEDGSIAECHHSAQTSSPPEAPGVARPA